MGLLSMSGIGAGMSAVADQNTKRWDEESLAKIRSDLDLQKAQALEQFKMNLVNNERANSASRMQGAMTGLLGAKYASSDAAVAAADAGQTDAPLTDDQKAVIAQSKASDLQAMQTDPKSIVRAGLQTGDIGVKDAAAMLQNGEKSEAQMRMLMQRQDDLNAHRTETNDLKRQLLEARGAPKADHFDDKTIQRERDKFEKPGGLQVPQFIRMTNSDPKATDTFAATVAQDAFDKLVSNGMHPSAAKTLVTQMITQAQGEASKIFGQKDNKPLDDYPMFLNRSMQTQFSAMASRGAKPSSATSAPAASASQPSNTPPPKADALPAPKTAPASTYSPSNLPDGMKKHTGEGVTVYKIEGSGNVYNSFEQALKAWEAQQDLLGKRNESMLNALAAPDPKYDPLDASLFD